MDNDEALLIPPPFFLVPPKTPSVINGNAIDAALGSELLSSCPRPRTPPSPFASYFRGGGRGRSPFSSPFLPLPDPFPSPDSRPNELAGASDLRDDDYDYDAKFNRRSRAASSPAGRRIPTAWRSSHHRPVPPSSYPSPDRDRRARRSRRWTTMTAAEDDIATSGRRDAFDTVS